MEIQTIRLPDNVYLCVYKTVIAIRSDFGADVSDVDFGFVGFASRTEHLSLLPIVDGDDDSCPYSLVWRIEESPSFLQFGNLIKWLYQNKKRGAIV